MAAVPYSPDDGDGEEGARGAKAQWLPLGDADGVIEGVRDLRSAARECLRRMQLAAGYFSQPRPLPTGHWVCSARCTLRNSCPRRYQFEGREDADGYKLRVAVSGQCGGEPARRKPRVLKDKPTPTKKEVLSVLRAADDVQELGFPPTAHQVALRMGEGRIGADSIRAILRNRMCQQGGTTQKFEESSQEFESIALKYQDPDSSEIYVAEWTQRAFSYSVMLPPFFAALARLLGDGVKANAHWSICGDFAHNMCVMNFKYGVVSAVIQRCLEGRWRRTFWPLLVMCAPLEDGWNYMRIFTIIKNELERRGMPLPKQVNLDHFDGSAKAAQQVLPKVRVVRDLEHMRRNIQSNHSKGKHFGRRARRKRAAKAKAKQRPQQRPEAAGERAGPPHLQNRPIWAVCLGVEANFQWTLGVAFGLT